MRGSRAARRFARDVCVRVCDRFGKRRGWRRGRGAGKPMPRRRFNLPAARAGRLRSQPSGLDIWFRHVAGPSLEHPKSRGDEKPVVPTSAQRGSRGRDHSPTRSPVPICQKISHEISSNINAPALCLVRGANNGPTRDRLGRTHCTLGTLSGRTDCPPSLTQVYRWEPGRPGRPGS
jgi:hypothetical protein